MRAPAWMVSFTPCSTGLPSYPTAASSSTSTGSGLPGNSRKWNENGESTCAGAISSMRSSALMRLWAWRAFVALARKRSTKRCEAGDLALLADVHRLLVRELRGALRLERRVVAGVATQPARVDVQDHGRGRVEELAVVRDEDQRPAIGREPALEPDHRVEVEVVGGLVEQQQVGAAHQGAREVETHPPAAGERADALRELVLGEAQAVEQGGRARARRVAFDMGVRIVREGEPLAVAGRIGRRRARTRSAAARCRRP